MWSISLIGGDDTSLKNIFAPLDMPNAILKPCVFIESDIDLI